MMTIVIFIRKYFKKKKKKNPKEREREKKKQKVHTTSWNQKVLEGNIELIKHIIHTQIY